MGVDPDMGWEPIIRHDPLTEWAEEWFAHIAVGNGVHGIRPISGRNPTAFGCRAWFSIPANLFHIGVKLDELAVRVDDKCGVIDPGIESLRDVLPDSAALFAEKCHGVLELLVIGETDGKGKELGIFPTTEFFAQRDGIK